MEPTRSVLDTSADVEERQIAYWRSMSPKERFDLVAAYGWDPDIEGW